MQDLSDASARPNRGIGRGRKRARTPEHKEEVRRKLIEAGQALLEQGRFQDHSLRKIAAQAGYSTGGVYSHFADKAALFHAIRDEEISKLEAEARARLPFYGETAESRLRGHVAFLREFTFKMVHRFGPASLSGGTETAAPDGRIEPFENQTDPSPAAGRMHALADAVVREFFDSLPAHPLDVALAADSLWGAINSTYTMAGASIHRRWSDPEAVGEVVLDALIASWKAQAALKAKNL